jgi:hypothetical protein
MTAFMCVAPLCVYVVLVVFMLCACGHVHAAAAFGLMYVRSPVSAMACVHVYYYSSHTRTQMRG